MNWKTAVCCAVIPLVTPLSAQTPVAISNVRLPAEIARNLRISTEEELQCDAAGNLVLRLGAGLEQASAPLVRLSPKAEVLARINLAAVRGFEKAVIWDFSARSDGETYLLAGKVTSETLQRNARGEVVGASRSIEPDTWIVVFSPAGSLVSKSKLAVQVHPRAVGVFGTGELLIIGDEGKEHLPFAGLFSRSGELLRKVILPDDLTRQEISHNHWAVAMDGVRVRVADDGNAYVLSGRYSPVLTVVSPEGDVISSVRVSLPDGAQEVWKQQFAAGLMAAEVVPNDLNTAAPRSIALFDANTGEVTRQFPMPESLGGQHLACFQNGLLTIVGDAGSLLFVRVGSKGN